MSTLELQGSIRTEIKKGKVKKLRSEDKIPAVVYGLGVASVQVTVARRDLEKLFKNPKGRNTIFQLNLGDKQERVMAYEISRDPISLKIIHIDFLRVDDSKPVKVDVPLQVVGNAPGIRMGGMLLHKLRRVVLKCLPGDIPEVVNVDIGQLQLDQYIQVKDLPTQDGKFVFLTNASDTVLQVIAPRKSDIVTDGSAQTTEASAAA